MCGDESQAMREPAAGPTMSPLTAPKGSSTTWVIGRTITTGAAPAWPQLASPSGSPPIPAQQRQPSPPQRAQQPSPPQRVRVAALQQQTVSVKLQQRSVAPPALALPSIIVARPVAVRPPPQQQPCATMIKLLAQAALGSPDLAWVSSTNVISPARRHSGAPQPTTTGQRPQQAVAAAMAVAEPGPGAIVTSPCIPKAASSGSPMREAVLDMGGVVYRFPWTHNFETRTLPGGGLWVSVDGVNIRQEQLKVFREEPRGHAHPKGAPSRSPAAKRDERGDSEGNSQAKRPRPLRL